MKKSIITALTSISLATPAISPAATAAQTGPEQASYIAMTAAPAKTASFAEFLTEAAPLVAQTEPGTKYWFALQAPEDELAIFDIFVNDDARDAHFAGKVAGALKANADNLVSGGWNDGVVANVKNSSVLSTNTAADIHSATTATYIKITAAPGQGDALAELLSAAGPIVTETEPKTLYWTALQLDENNFAIFDIFADDSGRQAHFAGKVAGLLKAKSEALVEGGWNDGVVANVKNYSILAIK